MHSVHDEANEQKRRGVLLVLTGPTGAGKDTLFHELLKKPQFAKITTTTSRPIRSVESEGNPYYFISREEFEKKIAHGDFFEWVEFRGELYGTQKKTLEEARANTKSFLWHIDAKGVKNIKEKVKEKFPRSVFVFLTAPSLFVLKQRVIKDEKLLTHHRWNESLVKWEMGQYDDCDYLVVNENNHLKKTVEQVLAIIEAKKLEIIPE